MSAALQDPSHARTTRLSVLVTPAEAAEIDRRAKVSGQSVSAFLRGQALMSAPAEGESDALRQVDALIERMERDLDGAIAAVNATLARLTKIEDHEKRLTRIETIIEVARPDGTTLRIAE